MIISMHGPPGAGKDAVGQILVKKHGFTKVAFADKLREICMALDPVVSYTWDLQAIDSVAAGKAPTLKPMRFSEAIQKHGYRRAKDEIPEVRRVLQYMATEVFRNYVHPDFWVNSVEDRIFEALLGNPKADFVITDMRFENEAKMVKRANGKIWLVQRNLAGLQLGVNSKHVSEAWKPAEDDINAVIDNNGSLKDLEVTVGHLLKETLQ